MCSICRPSTSSSRCSPSILMTRVRRCSCRTATRPILERLYKAGKVDRRHGTRVRYANPATGGWVMPTMGAQLALLPAGFAGERYRATDGTIFVCVEGEGATRIGEEEFAWTAGDVFVAPSWQYYSHAAERESVLFSIYDRPAQETLGICREIN